MKKRNGFTLIELLGTIVLISILIAMAVFSYAGYLKTTKEKAFRIEEKNLVDATKGAYADCYSNNIKNEFCSYHKEFDSKYKYEIVYLKELVNDSYINEIKDPYGDSKFCDSEKSYVYSSRKNSYQNNNAEMVYKVCLVCGDKRSEECLDEEEINFASFDTTCSAYYDAIGGTLYDGKWTDRNVYLSFGANGDFRYGIDEFEYKINNLSGKRVDANSNNSAVLTLNKTSSEQEYKVQAFDGMNGRGTLVSCGASVKIDKAPINSVSITGKNEVGDNVSNNVWTSKTTTLTANPNPTTSTSGYLYQWYLNGEKHGNQTTSGKVTVTEKGTYKVDVTNRVGKIVKTSSDFIAKVDIVKPTCSLKVTSGTLGDNNWYTSNVTIDWDKKDGTGSEIIYSNINKTLVTENGTTTVVGTVTDEAGNIGTCDISLKLDKTAPGCTNSGDSTIWTNANRIIYFGCSDSDSKCASGYTGGSTTFSVTTKTSTIGSYTIKDNAGNTTTCNARTANVYVDKIAPSCTNSGDSTSWTSGNRTIYYGCSDSDSGCASGYTGGSTTFSVTTKTSTIGSYTIKDNAGNTVTCNSRTANIYVDKTAPSCTNSGDSTSWTSGNRTINYGCSDSESGCASGYSGGSTTFSSTTKTSTIGSYTIKDNVGNTRTCDARTANIYVDKTAPSCTNSGDSTSWTNGNRTIYYGCSDSNSGCASGYSGGSATFSSTTKTSTIGSYTIKDNVGNTRTCDARTANVYVDKTAPSCTNSGDSTSWTNGNRTIYYGCSDSNSGCASGYSGGSTTFSSTTRTSTIGSYTIKDNTGNTATCSSRTANVYVDKTAPSCTNSGDSTSWTNGNRTIYYGCSDSNSGCASGYTGGNTTFSSTTRTSTIGSYTIKDNAGNTVTCNARTANVYVDKTAPSCTNSGDSTSWTNGNRTIYYGCSDSESGCASGYTGGSTTFSSSTKTSTIGSYTIKDNVGNTRTCSSRTANVYVDKTAPSTANIAITDFTFGTYGVNYTISASASDSHSGISRYQYSVDDGSSWTDMSGSSVLINLSNAVHRVKTRAIDNMGYVSPVSSTFYLTTTKVFVGQLYQEALGRIPAQWEMDTWELKYSDHDASKIAHGILFSDEANNRLTTPESFVRATYQGMLGRTPGSSEVSVQVNLYNSSGKVAFFKSITNSVEFDGYCSKYGIPRNNWTADY